MRELDLFFADPERAAREKRGVGMYKSREEGEETRDLEEEEERRET